MLIESQIEEAVKSWASYLTTLSLIFFSQMVIEIKVL